VTGVAPQTVELPHCEYVAGLQPVQGFGQLRAFDFKSASHYPRATGRWAALHLLRFRDGQITLRLELDAAQERSG
jgi:hypothetical protein